MIGTLITLFLVTAAAGAVFGVWHYFADFLKDAMNYVAEKVKGLLHVVLAGSQALLRKVWGGIKEIVKSFTYDRERDKWKVTTTERDIPPDKVEEEVPDYIRARVEREQNREHDVTDEVELKLKECA
mgnify:CR=1 FL=1